MTKEGKKQIKITSNLPPNKSFFKFWYPSPISLLVLTFQSKSSGGCILSEGLSYNQWDRKAILTSSSPAPGVPFFLLNLLLIKIMNFVIFQYLVCIVAEGTLQIISHNAGSSELPLAFTRAHKSSFYLIIHFRHFQLASLQLFLYGFLSSLFSLNIYLFGASNVETLCKMLEIWKYCQLLWGGGGRWVKGKKIQ